jgi:hypothetical protein
MLTATLAAVLIGGLSPGANAALPNLHTDYAQAKAIATAGNKPMAVFIGRGSGTMGRMLADGSIPSDAAHMLRDRYVALYLDTQTPAGKEVADRFALVDGLVISSPGGSVQAYRHAGSLGGQELTRQLGQYATASEPARTVYAGTGAAPTASGVIVGGMSPAVIPASVQYMVPQYAIPAGGFGYPGFGGPGFGPVCLPGGR